MMLFDPASLRSDSNCLYDSLIYVVGYVAMQDEITDIPFVLCAHNDPVALRYTGRIKCREFG